MTVSIFEVGRVITRTISVENHLEKLEEVLGNFAAIAEKMKPDL